MKERGTGEKQRQVAHLTDNLAELPAAAATVVREKLVAYAEHLAELEAERTSLLVRRRGCMRRSRGCNRRRHGVPPWPRSSTR